ncbi:hypothetical protein K488DRAFT_92470 [Vararia minispora EC-137]|uniref:Uncharacterized protein n=1 Tax=Vararia minispora EC-137 TaxID=1314806 RepID=A0ACB8Q4E0_9AGAM|nr:hypothetical protein K488DRAFT_92470 [Vararia minispora EC-137]
MILHLKIQIIPLKVLLCVILGALLQNLYFLIFHLNQEEMISLQPQILNHTLQKIQQVSQL